MLGGVRAVVVGLLLVAAAGAATAGIADPVGQTGDVEVDSVVMRADVAAGGDAVWTIEYRSRLDDRNTTDAFDSLRADLRANESRYADQFAGRMNATVGAAAEATDREMAVRNVSVTAERRRLPQEYGVVRYRFEWVGFAAVEGDRLVVGDAVAGLFLDGGTRFVVSWPEGYEATVSPAPDERGESSATWVGPREFGAGQPEVVAAPSGGSSLSLPVVLLGAGLVAAVVVAVWYRRRGESDGVPAGGDEQTSGGDSDDGPAGGGEAGAAGAAGATGEGIPEDLLSPEERVLGLLRERGGRVKQQDVVAEFDWTAARTSQVVGSLREDGEIETFRLGRENVLTLPDTGATGEPRGEGAEDGETDED